MKSRTWNSMAHRCAPSIRLLALAASLWTLNLANAADYGFSSATDKPGCSGGTWSVSGSTHSCSGSLNLASGDRILPAASITLSITSGISLPGNNQVGSASSSVNLQNSYNTIQSFGTTTIYGSVTNASGGVTLQGTTVSGTVRSNSGTVTLSNASVQGLISSGCCAITLTSTNASSGINSSSDTISVTGGTIAGPISTSGGNGVILNNVTMTAGSITATNVRVTINNSTIGSSGASIPISGNGIDMTSITMSGGSIGSVNSPINITGSSIGATTSSVAITTSNQLNLRNNTRVYGSATSASWGMDIDNTSIVYGTCSPTHTRCNICSPSTGIFYINESNTKENWAEIYTRAPTSISGWKLKSCSLDNKLDLVCREKDFSFNPAFEGNYTILDFDIDFHDKAVDFLLTDNSGRMVDYFRVGMDLGDHPLQQSTAQQCGLVNSCNVFNRTNNGQRNFARIPDGGCSWEDSNWQNNTQDYSNTPKSLNHLRIEHSGSGVTCAPTTLTITACANADCSQTLTGYTGTLSAAGTPTVNWGNGTSFTTGAGGITTKQVQVSTPGTVTWGSSTSATACYVGSTATCNFTAARAGFLIEVPNHQSGVQQTATISAVRQSDNTSACVPALTNAILGISLDCGFTNPDTGSQPVVLGDTSLTCGTSQAFDMAFDEEGKTTTTLLYSDVGRMTLSASYSGGSGLHTGLSMSGSGNFIVAPHHFSVTPAAGPYVAGQGFNATLKALNAAGEVTGNFGKESPPEGIKFSRDVLNPVISGISWNKPELSGTTSIAGSQFASGNGSTTATGIKWTEVGEISLIATLTSGSYLGSEISASGSATVAPIRPAYFDTEVTPGCGSFTYSGQPFTLKIIAKEAGGLQTKNYLPADSLHYAKNITISDTNSSLNQSNTKGSLSTSTISRDTFTNGVSTTSNLIFTFSPSVQGPLETSPLKIRAIDTDDVSSEGHSEGTTSIRSGRLRVANAFGAGVRDLRMEAGIEYFDGSVWKLNAADNCTTLANLQGPTATPLALLVQPETPVSPAASTTPYCLVPGTSTSCSTTSACNSGSTVTSGQLGICLTKPGGSGYVDIKFTPPAYLHQGTATGRAAFGLYNRLGNTSRIIDRREWR